MGTRTSTLICATLLTAATAFACGEDVDPNPNRPRQQASRSGLSTAYDAACARCHGDEGRGLGIYPAIPGDRDEASFIAIVRSGRGEMPATDASQMSDETLKADYLWLTTERQ